ncbi:hypothetical protein [Salmonella enterica]|uniref:hypothetical protein n=1 Tax=Salmonella enterica TaxID=28901 RepID=UPI00201E4E38|nr:hypothetical protein [Salmonella enterica]
MTEPLKVIVPPPASVVAIAPAAKAEVAHIIPAAVMASIILLHIDNNMSFEQMRIIEHRLKTGLKILMRSVQVKQVLIIDARRQPTCLNRSQDAAISANAWIIIRKSHLN